ncbi:type IV pilin [Halobellus rubicundus]|uniref:Type IV pilin n=1 Tax=Halobellus rubicundus TaxID=2996466 RepID=A0ABD5M8L6_9EURY
MDPSIRGSTRAVSPAIGTALMLAILVAIVAVFGGLLLGIEMPSEPTPQYRHQTEYVADGAGNTDDRPYVNITLTGGRIEPGEDFCVVDGDGNAVRWDQVWTTDGPLTAGDYAHIDGYGSDGALNHACEGEVYRMVHRPDDGQSATILEVEIDSPAVGPAASHC